MTQRDVLLKHFKKEGHITAVEAAAVYKIRSLPRRILDLKERGHKITTTRHRDGTGQLYVRYHYGEPEKAAA